MPLIMQEIQRIRAHLQAQMALSIRRSSIKHPGSRVRPRLRAPNVPPTTVNNGLWRSVSVTASEDSRLVRNVETAGQKVSDLRWEWWPGAGSNRRPSDSLLGQSVSRERRGQGHAGARLLEIGR